MVLRRGRVRSPLELLAACAHDVAGAGLASTGLAAVCCRPVSGPAFAAARERLAVSTRSDARLVHWDWDVNGQQWALLTGESLRKLALAAASVERALARDNFGGLLLWTVLGLRDAGDRPVHLVHDHRTRLFSLFAPRDGHIRDSTSEQAAAAALPWLPLEPDPLQWSPVWESPLAAG